MGVLPGIGGVAAPAFVPPSVVFVAAASSSSSTVSKPTGVVEGDFLVMVDVAGNTSGDGAVTAVTPSGWANRVNRNSAVYNYQRFMVHTKIAGPSEPSSYTGMNSRGERKVVLAFRRSELITTITPSADTFTESTGDPSSINANYTGVLGTSITLGIVADYHADSLGSAGLGGWDGIPSVGENNDLLVFYNTDDVSGPNVAIDHGDSGILTQLMLINFRLT